MDAELIALIAGVILSLAFSYIPGLNTKYAALSEELKKLIMIGLLAAVAFGAYGLSCAGWFEDLTGIVITCDKSGFVAVLKAFVAAAIGNQTTHRLTPATNAVKVAKIEG